MEDLNVRGVPARFVVVVIVLEFCYGTTEYLSGYM
jgi:hypothetical protein